MEQIFYPIYEASAVIFFFSFPTHATLLSPSLYICHLLLVFLVAFPYFSSRTSGSLFLLRPLSHLDASLTEQKANVWEHYPFSSLSHLLCRTFTLSSSPFLSSPFLLFQLTSLFPYFIPIAATTSTVCNYSCSRILHVLDCVCDCVNTYAYTRHALNLKDAHIAWQQNAKLYG